MTGERNWLGIIGFVFSGTETPGYSIFYYYYYYLKCSRPPLDITSIRVLPCNFRNSSLFTAACKTSPTARGVSAANHMLLLENKFCANLWHSLSTYLCFCHGLGLLS